jgi:hypothetical protein
MVWYDVGCICEVAVAVTTTVGGDGDSVLRGLLGRMRWRG